VATTEPVPTQDFYVTGGTLRPDAPSYIPRQADDDLFDALSRGEFAYVLTSRQMGKSSLMARTAQRLRQDGSTSVVLDLTAVGQNLTPQQWYGGLLSRLGRAVDLEDELDDFWYDNEQLGPMQRWVDAIERVVFPRTTGPIVVFIDEIDMVRSLSFSTNEFFAGIRECYTRRAEDEAFARLTFCLIGVATPSDLIDDPRVTPFNIGHRVELTDFTADEAGRLADGLGRDADTSAALLSRVLHWTGGHPYLTQRLSHAVASDASVVHADAVDRLCADLFFSERAQEQDSNLQFVRNQMLAREDVDSADLLTFYRDVRSGKSAPHDETNPVVNVLQLAGVAHAVDGHMRVRNRIYEHVFDTTWVSENMPNAELRRQRAAYRRGILRTGGIAAAVLVVVAALAVYGFVQSRRAEGATENALEITARAQIEQGVEMLKDGNELGLLYLVEARRNAPEGSALRGSAERLWAGWHEAFEGRIDLVIDVADPTASGFHPGGRVLAVGTRSGSVLLLDPQTGQPLHESLEVGREVTAIAFSADGDQFAVGDSAGSVHLYNASTWTLISSERVTDARVRSVVFSHDGKRLASMASNRTLDVHETIDWTQVGQTLELGFSSTAIAISPNGELVAFSRAGGIDIVEVDTGDVTHSIITEPLHGGSVHFNRDGKTLLACARGGRLSAWDTSTWDRRDTGIEAQILAFSVGSRDRLISVIQSDGLLRLWRLDGPTPVGRPFYHRELTVPAFSPDGARIAVHTSQDDRVILWRVAPPRPERVRVAETAPWAGGASAAYSPDGHVAALGDHGMLRLFDTETWRPLVPPLRHESEVWDVEFSSDGSHLLSADSGAGVVRLWDMARSHAVWSPATFATQAPDIAYHRDGSVIAVATNAGAYVLDAATGQRVGGPVGEVAVWGVALSPVAHVMAVCGAGGVELWDVDAWEKTGFLPTDDGGNALVATFTEDGTQIIVGGSSPNAVVWDIATLSRVGSPMTVPTQAGGVVLDSREEQLLVVDVKKGHAQRWDIPSRHPIGPSIPSRPHVARVAIHPNDREAVLPSQIGIDVLRFTQRVSNIEEMEQRTWATTAYRMGPAERPAPVDAVTWHAAREHIAGATSRPLPAPVRCLLATDAGVVTAYWDDETEAVSTDSGALWSVGVTGAPWDTLVSTPDGTFATSQDGRKLMSESGTETPDVGSSAAMVDARLSRISVRDYGYRLEVSDDDGVTWTMAALNEADPYIRSVHVVDGQFYTVASLAPHQVHRLGGAYAVPLWRVLRVATPDATDPARQLDVDWLHAVGLGSEKDCSTVTAFPDATMEFELDGWTTYTAKSGVVDLSHPSSEEGAYLATLVHSPRAQTARVFFSARDSGRLWMNGKRLDGGPTFRIGSGEMRYGT
jgi:WD40 repeat protein